MICKDCYNDGFYSRGDGLFYCQICNCLADEIIETADNEEDYQTKHTRRPPPQPIKPGTLSYEDYHKEARDRYVKGFLMMITHQCDALVDKFNVTPLIIGLVGPISLRFVALSGVFDDDWADKAIHNSELQSKQTKGKRRNKDEDEPKNLNGKRAITIWVSELKKSLPLSSSLAISFLACHKAGASILPTEIVRWAREGKIPYLSCFQKIVDEMGNRSDAQIMFRPFRMVSAQILEARAASIADTIGLSLPPVNFYGIASNYLNRLCISDDNKKILDLVSVIKKWSMPSDLYLSKNEFKLPTRVCVMSIIIVAIRMVYKINGFGVWERSLGLVNNTSELDSPIHDDEDVLETESTDRESLEDDDTTATETEKLLKNLEAKYYDIVDETSEYEKDLLSYLSHGKNEILAGLEEASADNTYVTVDSLWNGYPKDEVKKRVRDWEDDLSLNQLSLDDDNKFSDRNYPCGIISPSKRSKSGSMDHDHSSSPENYNYNLEERSKTRLITDMAENLFCYIPPRVKVKRRDYLQYARKREDGAFIYPAHADYYILLRICARVAEIDVRNMHRGVLSFERRLSWIEKRIDQVLHLTLPSMTCHHCCDGGNVDQDDGFLSRQCIGKVEI